MNKVLIIAAHPDDEVLGCGGTIANHTAKGDTVHVLFMTNGLGSRVESSSEDVLNRQSMAYQSADILGVKSLTFLDFPDNSMDSIPLLNVVKKIEEEVNNFQPEIIYTHHIGDLNIDHQVTHKAVMTACRPQPNFCVKEIYCFEVLSSTEWTIDNLFSPNCFVDILGTFELKMTAMKMYGAELRPYPHARSIESVKVLAQYRGLSVGIELAESFIIKRILLHSV